MRSVLFVCTANICRSPLGEGLLKKHVEKIGQADEWEITSAGTWARNGLPAARNSEKLLMDRGIDISDHGSRLVTHEILAKADVVFTMESGHKEALMIEFPDMKNKIYMLSELAGYEFDVADPIGQEEAAFAVTIKEIEGYIVDGFEKIVELTDS